MLLFYTAIGFMCILLLKKYGIFLMLPLFLITGPAIFTTFYAVLCREGGFWEIISEAISLSFNRWFKIIGYTLLFGICCMAVFLAVGYGITSVFESIKLVPIGSLIFSLFQICFMVFQQCFCTALYLDLANVKPQQEIEVRETLDDEPILKQNIEQHVEQKPMQSSNDNQEPPHMDVLK